MNEAAIRRALSLANTTYVSDATKIPPHVLQRIVDGQGRAGDLELLRSAAGQIEGHTICAFGEAAAWPVQGMLRHFWAEFEYFVSHGRSMVEEQQGLAA